MRIVASHALCRIATCSGSVQYMATYANTTMRMVHSVAQHHGELLARLGAAFLSRGPPGASRDVDGTAWPGAGALAGVGLGSSESLEASSAVIRDEVSLDT